MMVQEAEQQLALVKKLDADDSEMVVIEADALIHAVLKAIAGPHTSHVDARVLAAIALKAEEIRDDNG